MQSLVQKLLTGQVKPGDFFIGFGKVPITVLGCNPLTIRLGEGERSRVYELEAGSLDPAEAMPKQEVFPQN